MSKSKKFVFIALFVVLMAVALVLGKWYQMTTRSTIDPQSGIYGMSDLEIWIDINRRLPDPMRKWGCETLMAREKAVTGSASLRAPYGCAANFGQGPATSAYDSVVSAYRQQGTAELGADKGAVMTSCMDKRLAEAATPEQIAAMNGGDQEAMRKLSAIVSDTARACRAEAMK